MKNKILIGGLLAVFAIFVTACNKKAEETPAPVIDNEKIKMEIQAIENTFANHYNTKNADSITYYADDAKSYFIGREPISGKDAILEYLTNDIKGTGTGLKFSFTTNEVHVSNDGQLVTEIGQFLITDSIAAKQESGNYISLFEKRNGKYVCIRDMAVSDIPRAEK